MEQSLARGQITSAVPGRIRLRVPHAHRPALPRLKAHLGQQPGIQHVTVNHLTGSALITCDHDAISTRDIVTMCYDVGVIVSGLADGDGELISEEGLNNGSSDALVEAIDDMDRRLAASAKPPSVVTIVIPLIFGAIGARQLVVYGLGQASGYLLIWVSVRGLFRVYRRLHQPTAPKSFKRLTVGLTANGATVHAS
jgi:hypothetical protein